ncbi:MAG: SufE family protein [Pseudomonadales bacterium]|nr:SufE family protein [Pseudomonadales bacterium]
MTDTYLEKIPYGQSIDCEDILENFEFLDDWEERYRFIIDLGKQLPGMPEKYHTDINKIVGCQSQVWVIYDTFENQYRFGMDSDSLIVRGLICIVLSALNYKTKDQITCFDMEDFFAKLDLSNHLSMQRGNGLLAMVKRIKHIAA